MCSPGRVFRTPLLRRGSATMDVAYAARFPMERSRHPTLNGSESSQRSQTSGGMCSHMLHCKGEERHTPRPLSRTTTVSRHGVGGLVEPRHIVRFRGRSTLSTNSGKAPYARPSRLAYIISGPHPPHHTEGRPTIRTVNRLLHTIQGLTASSCAPVPDSDVASSDFPRLARLHPS